MLHSFNNRYSNCLYFLIYCAPLQRNCNVYTWYMCVYLVYKSCWSKWAPIYGHSWACILQSLEFLATAECFNGTQYSALHAASIQYIRIGLPIPSIHLNFCFQFTSAKTKYVEVQSQLSLHAFLLSLKTCTESRNVVTACFCSFVNTWQYLDTMQN